MISARGGDHRGACIVPINIYTTLDDPSASNGTIATSINGAGQIVGYYLDASLIRHGFLLSNGTYTTLDDPLAPNGTFPSGINGAGQVVGYYTDANFKSHGFLLSGGTYTPLDDTSATNGTFATGMNGAGQIVGYYFNNTGTHGFLYNPNVGNYTTLDDPLATQGTFATGINAAGLIVGYYGNATGTHGFLLVGTNYITLDDPSAFLFFNNQFLKATQAFGINDAGQIVGTYQANGTFGFLYNLNTGTYTTLDDPLAPFLSTANGINAAGQTVGQYTDSNHVTHGLLITPMPNPAPPAGTTADMVLRHGSDGQYEIYDIGSNAILAGYQLGQVGTDWKFVGLGGLFGSDTTDMLLRSASTGGFEVYDISNNNITNAAFLGNVGMDWQVMGFGNFSSRGETDMILRNVNSGGVEVYDISNNQITGAV
jgi:probable HAF family extracellular repeat protein